VITLEQVNAKEIKSYLIMLAMKAISARVDSLDASDVRMLIDLLKLKTAGEVLDIVEKYYPREQIKPATQFFIEELFGQ
jgi:hypothetical protein